MSQIIAAYTAAPATSAEADAYYAEVGDHAEADTLGLSWKGPESAAEIRHRVRRLPTGWGIAITTVPGTFRSWSADHRHGLASGDPDGRAQAVTLAAQIAQVSVELADRCGWAVVRQVEVHGAPGFGDRTHAPRPDALRASLEQLAALDWAGASVTLEHCDAYVPGNIPAKGFLPLDTEITVLSELGSSIGLSLNWGRSVLELRDPNLVGSHVRTGASSGLLRLLTLSGAAARDNSYGAAWADSHLPLADGAGEYIEPASLLTVEHVAESVRVAGEGVSLGTKVAWRRDQTDPITRARAVLANHAAVVDAATHALAGVAS